jgi:hypothetical protein
MRGSAAISLSLLNLVPERKVKCYNGYFVNGISFILKNTGMEEKHTTAVFVLRDRLLVSLKLTIMVDWKRSSNCNIIASRIECFYSNAIGMTQLTEESE